MALIFEESKYLKTGIPSHHTNSHYIRGVVGVYSGDDSADYAIVAETGSASEGFKKTGYGLYEIISYENGYLALDRYNRIRRPFHFELSDTIDGVLSQLSRNGISITPTDKYNDLIEIVADEDAFLRKEIEMLKGNRRNWGI